MNPEISRATGGEDNLNDFAACEINKKEDLRELFGRFYFGCEAEDRMNATAFNTKANPMNARLNALFSSDIGHFDVAHMDEVGFQVTSLLDDGRLQVRRRGGLYPRLWEAQAALVHTATGTV